VARALNNLGMTWAALGEYNKTMEYYHQALSIYRAAYGEEHPYLATTLSNLGSAYFDLGKIEQAKDYYEKAYEIFNETFGPGHPNTKTVSECLKLCQLT
jgi:tetratricopeptide (TPR) repeat protein